MKGERPTHLPQVNRHLRPIAADGRSLGNRRGSCMHATDPWRTRRDGDEKLLWNSLGPQVSAWTTGRHAETMRRRRRRRQQRRRRRRRWRDAVVEGKTTGRKGENIITDDDDDVPSKSVQSARVCACVRACVRALARFSAVRSDDRSSAFELQQLLHRMTRR
jgi:hypothetical protein